MFQWSGQGYPFSLDFGLFFDKLQVHIAAAMPQADSHEFKRRGPFLS